jgi:hypothetical protein
MLPFLLSIPHPIPWFNWPWRLREKGILFHSSMASTWKMLYKDKEIHEGILGKWR